MPTDNTSSSSRTHVTGSGTNGQGNHYCNRADSGGNTGYHYSNTNGSYYYNNPNGSTYYNSGRGYSQYTSPSGQSYKSCGGKQRS